MNYKVSVNYCEDYSFKAVDECLEKGLASIGGLNSFVKPKMKVMLKCNLSKKCEPNDALTTHPMIVSVLAEKIFKLGASCVIVDTAESCSNNAMDRIYEVTEMLNVSNEGYAELNTNFDVYKVDVDGVMTKQLTLIDAINDCDIIINIPKFIANENGLSMAVDNLLGLIPSEMKVIAKNRLFDADSYNNYLLDLYNHIKEKVVLTVVDGIVAREVNGQRILNVVLAGANLFAVDKLCYKLANLNPDEASLFKVAEKRNFFTKLDEVQVVGTSLDMFSKEDFAKPQRDFENVSKRKQKSRYKTYQKRPIVQEKECKGCKRCIWACPVNAIIEARDKNNEICAIVDYSKCINCLRCVKACPYSAIDTKVPAKFNRLNAKIEKRVKK